MELPRTASHTSLCPASIQLLSDLRHPRPDTPVTPISTSSTSRTPASRRLLSVNATTTTTATATATTVQPAEPQFALLPSAAQYQPSRRREEARVLQNLRKRLQAVRVLQANRPEPIEALAPSANNNVSQEDLVNRNFLFQKILSHHPVSMVLDVSDLRTAWKDSDFITDCLCWHNVYRQRHGSPPLTMSSELCYLAQTWANHLAHTNRFYYRNEKDIGQNLFCRPANPIVTDVTGQEVATYWYSAVRQYEFRKEPDILHANVNTGHFTQLVWRSSKHFGIGKARSRSGKIVVVAHYAPAGNTSGAYLTNVLPPIEFSNLPHDTLAQQRYMMSGGSSASDSSRYTSST